MNGKKLRLGILLASAVLAAGPLPAAQAEGADAAAEATAEAADEQEMIQINFPESVEIRLLVQYVSKRMGLNILYDDAVGTKRVMISSPTKIPKDSLLGLLQSVLKMADLTLVDSDQPGWKRIVPSKDLLRTTRGLGTDRSVLDDSPPAIPVTQMFELKHVTTAVIERTIRPFLSEPGGNTLAIAERKLLVTDFAANVRRVAELIELMDRPGRKATIQFVDVINVPAAELAARVDSLLREKDSVAGGPQRPAEREMVLSPEPRTNRIAVISTEGWGAEAVELIRALDTPSNLATRTYRFQHVSPDRVDRLVKQLATAEGDKTAYRSTIDRDSGLLIASASPGVHERIVSLKRDLDLPGAQPTSSPLRFYKLMNTTAGRVLATIRAIESGGGGLDAVALGAEAAGGNDGRNEGFTGANRPPGPPGAEAPKPPSYKEQDGETPPASQAANGGITTARTRDAVVTADENTNTIIVVAPPAVQRIYEQLIAILDKRRPQVLIEAIMVTLDTSDGFSLGVEISRADAGEDKRCLTFSSFGLSTVDPATGGLTLTPGLGFNGTLVSPDTVDIVIRALASSGRAKVLSAPKVLVNDNATARISSVAESPFTSINASQTVSTTSFAGYASAGTTLTVTPHISEGDHLQVDYSVSLNSFTGEGAAGVPPPRQTDELNSEVTIPDGYAIIVGGLKRQDASATISKVPWLGDVPLLEYLFSSRSTSDAESTLFVFIRPIILRDDQFEDLRYLSDRELALAEMPPNLPPSDPMLMRSGEAGSLDLVPAEPDR